MNLWAVCESGVHWEENTLLTYWSWGSDQAVEEYVRQWRQNAGYGAESLTPECSVRRMETADSPLHDYPHEEQRTAVLRRAGLAWESDQACEMCHLYEAAGEYPVCDDCCCCTECGCQCEPPTHAVGFDPLAMGC